MSVSTAAPVRPATTPAGDPSDVARPVTLRRVVRAESIKFWTLRSTVGVLAAAVIGMVAIAMIVALNTRKLTGDVQLEDVLPSATLQGYYLGQLLIGALGVLFVTGEYSTGMIRSTLAAVPKRLPVLVAKLLVFLAVVATAMLAASVVAFLGAQALLGHYRTGFSLGDPGVLRVVLGTGIYLTLVGVIGMAIGWIVRSTPGSLVTYIAVVLVVPGIFSSVLGSWGRHIAQYMPSQAGASFSTSLHLPPSLSPWVGLGVMVLWTVAGLVVAVLSLLRRDA
ncbi:MAG: type transport system permease protein [Frankiaceae bacterium]|nr:type transport system permease protein [Frankiaceae bacterium]